MLCFSLSQPRLVLCIAHFLSQLLIGARQVTYLGELSLIGGIELFLQKLESLLRL